MNPAEINAADVNIKAGFHPWTHHKSVLPLLG